MEPVHVHVAILSVGSTTARAGVAMENIVADALTAAGHQVSAFESVKDSEVAVRSQLVGFIEDPDVDMVIVVGEGEAPAKALRPLIIEPLPGFADLLRMLAFQDIGASAMLSGAEAAKCGHSTFVFVLPGGDKAVQQAMEKLILPQLDPNTQPRNLIGSMPRLREEADVTRVDNAAGPADSIPTPISPERERTAAGFGITRLPAKPAPQLMTRVKSATGKNVIVRQSDPQVGDTTKPIELQKLEKQIEMSKPTSETKALDPAQLPALPAVNKNVLPPDPAVEDKHVFSAKTNPAYVPVTKEPVAITDDGPTVRDSRPRAPVAADNMPTAVAPVLPRESDNKPTVVAPAPTRPESDNKPTVVAPAPTRPSENKPATPPETDNKPTVVAPAPTRADTDVDAPGTARADTNVDQLPPAADQIPAAAAYRAEGVTTVRPAVTPVVPGAGPPKPPPGRGLTPATGSPIQIPKLTGKPRPPTPAIGLPIIPQRPQTPASGAPIARITPVPRAAIPPVKLGPIPGGTIEVGPDAGASIEELDSSLLRESSPSVEMPPLEKPKAPNVVSLAELEKESLRDSSPTVDMSPRADEKRPAAIMAAAPPATLESLMPPMPPAAERLRAPTPPPIKRAPTEPPKPVEAKREPDPTPFSDPPAPKRRSPTRPPADFGALPVSAQVAELPQGSFDYKLKKRSRWPLILLALIAAGTIAFFLIKILQTKRPEVAAGKPDAAAPVATPDAEQVAVQTPDASEPVIEIEDAAEPPPAVDANSTSNRIDASVRVPADAGRIAVNPPIDAARPVVIDAAPGSDVPVAASPDCDEVSCVLEKYARPCCQRFKPPDSTFKPGDGDSLSKTQIKAGVDRMRATVIQCAEQSPAKGTVKVSVTVNGEGAVTNVAVAETPPGGDTLGNCIAGVMRRAQFAKTKNGGSFTYPFVF